MRLPGNFRRSKSLAGPVGRRRFLKVAKNVENTCISLEFAYNAAISYTQGGGELPAIGDGPFLHGL